MSKDKKNEVIELVKFFALVLVLIIVLKGFVFSTAKVNEVSMEKTFYQNDILVFEKLSNFTKNYKKGEIVIFKGPGTTKHYIKRIIATEGDTVEIKDGKVFLNDKELDEPYLTPGTLTTGEDYLKDNQKITIEKGQIFTMGDHREKSYDSRGFGPVDKSTVDGIVKIQLFPLNKIRYFK